MFYIGCENAPIPTEDSLTVEDYAYQFLLARTEGKFKRMQKPGYRLIKLLASYTVEEIRALFAEIEQEVSK